MIPKPELNIYPKSEENIQALLEFHFDKYNLPFEDAVEKIIAVKNLKLNQIEFIIRKLSEAWPLIFSDFLKITPNVSNLFRYGIESLTKPQSEWTHIKSQRDIMNAFLQFVKDTEVDINYLEKNN